MAFEFGAFLAALERAWSRSTFFLWAFALALLVAFAGLRVGARLDPESFGGTSRSAGSWLLGFGLALLTFAIIRSVRDRRNPPLRFVPTFQQCYWHVTQQKDSSWTIQINLRFEVYNLSNDIIIF